MVGGVHGVDCRQFARIVNRPVFRLGLVAEVTRKASKELRSVWRIVEAPA